MSKLNLLSAAVLTASLAATATAAHAQNTLYLAGYGGSIETVMKEKVLPAWEQANNTKIEYVPGNSTTTLAKLQAQKANQEIDVAFIDDGPMSQAIALGFCENVEDKGPLSGIYDSAVLGGGKALGFGYIATGLTYNKDMFAKNGWDAPTSWTDLEDPKFKGKVVVPPITNGYGLLTLIKMAKINGGGEANIDPGFDAMIERIGPNILTYEPSSGKLSELFQAGDVAIAAWGHSRAKGLANTGFPAGFAYPDEGAVAIMVATCPVVDSDVPELSQSLVNYLVSPEVQAILATELSFGPVHKETKVSDEVAAQVPFGPEQVGKMDAIDYSIVNPAREAWTKRWNRTVE